MRFETKVGDIVVYDNGYWTVRECYTTGGLPHVKLEKGKGKRHATGRFAYVKEYLVELWKEPVSIEAVDAVNRDAVKAVEAPEQVTEAFVKHDNGKVPLSFVYDTPEAIKAVCRVQEFGANKYTRSNWSKCTDIMRYRDAAMRHHMAQGTNVDEPVIDDESNEAHLAHAICCMLFDLELLIRKNKDKDKKKCQKT